MGTWRSSREMEKLHARFVDGCRAANGLTDEQAEELFRQVAAFASFGFAKSHAAAFARTAYESAFLKLFYPAQFTVGLINAQPMGFYPVEVLINDAKRHGVAVLPVDVNASDYRTTTEWVGAGEPAGDGDDGRPTAIRAIASGSTRPRRALVRLHRPARPRRASAGRPRRRPATASASGWPGEGDRRGARGAPGRRAGPRPVPLAGGRRGPDRAARGGDRAADPGRRARLAGPAAARAALAAARGDGRDAGSGGRPNGRAERAGDRRGGDRRARRSAPRGGRWTCACRRRRLRSSPR